MAPRMYNCTEDPYSNHRLPVGEPDADSCLEHWLPLSAADNDAWPRRAQAGVNAPTVVAASSGGSASDYKLAFDGWRDPREPADSLQVDAMEKISLACLGQIPALSPSCSSTVSQADVADLEMADVLSPPLSHDMLEEMMLDDDWLGPLVASSTAPWTALEASIRGDSTRCCQSDSDSTPDTASAGSQKPHSCTCGFSCRRLTELERHAKEETHKPFECFVKGCAASFTRRDALLRHRSTTHAASAEISRYECSECERYKGVEAFKRRDHLVQHVRKVHPNHTDRILSPNYCTVSSCRLSGKDGLFGGFLNRKDQAKHMRDAHGPRAMGDQAASEGMREALPKH